MNIRLASHADLESILAISNWAAINTPANFAIEPETIESWTESFIKTQAMFPWLVADSSVERDARRAIIGFAKASPHRGRCAYAWAAEISVYVHPDHHGRGVGKALYSELIPMLRAQGYATLIAGITTPNPTSERLHQSFGFRHVGTFHRVGWKFDRWHDVSYWELALNDGEAPRRPLAVVEVTHDDRSRPPQRGNPVKICTQAGLPPARE